MPDYRLFIRQSDDDEYEVWLDSVLDPHATPGANSLILGTGRTRSEALEHAKDELEAHVAAVGAALSDD